MDYNVMETQLKGEYREVFSKAVLYASLKNISAQAAEEKLCDLYDLLLTAQSEEKPARKLVGKDINGFCREYFADFTIADRLSTIPASLYRVAWFVLVLETIALLAGGTGEAGFFAAKADYSGVGVGIAAAALMYIVSEVVLAPLFARGKSGKGVGGWYWLLAIMFAAFIGVGMKLTEGLSLMLPMWPFVLGSAGYILLYTIARAVYRYKTYGTLRDERRLMEQDSYYKNLQDRDLEKILLTGWQKRFQRLEKRGKTTRETYLDKLLKEEELGRKIIILALPIGLAVVTLVDVVERAMESSLQDALAFALFMAVTEFFICRWIIRGEKKQSALRMKHLNACRERSVTLPDYIEETLKGY